MSIELSGNGNYLSLRACTWEDILGLARRFGWKPQGTSEPYYWDAGKCGKWSGGYISNDWQTIEEEDAFQLSLALIKAMGALEDQQKIPPSRRFFRADYDLVKQVFRMSNSGAITIY